MKDERRKGVWNFGDAAGRRLEVVGEPIELTIRSTSLRPPSVFDRLMSGEEIPVEEFERGGDGLLRMRGLPERYDAATHAYVDDRRAVTFFDPTLRTAFGTPRQTDGNREDEP